MTSRRSWRRSRASTATIGRSNGRRSVSTTRRKATRSPSRARPGSRSAKPTCSPSTIAASPAIPVASTPGKKEAYRHSLRIFRKAAKYFDPPLQVVEYPCDDLKLTGYLQIPKGVAKPPVVLHWGGVDGWKENRQHASAALHRLGLATFTVDMPGTGEHPLRYIDPRAERTYSAAIDHLVSAATSTAAASGSGAAASAATGRRGWRYTEAKRLKGAVFHGGNVHYGFQRDWLEPALTKTASTYLFGPRSLFEARSQAMGVKTLEEFLEAAPKLSLKDHGAARQALGAHTRHQRQARRPGAGPGHLSPDGAWHSEGSAYLPRGRPHGPHAGDGRSVVTETIANWLKLRL